MPEIVVTPKGGTVMVYPVERKIVLPARERWERVNAKVARIQDRASRLAPFDFEERIAAFHRGEQVELAGEGQLRLGVGCGLQVNGKMAYLLFDGDHQTRPGHTTPAAGMFEGHASPSHEGYRELCEEILVVHHGKQLVGSFRRPDVAVYEEYPRAYADRMGYAFETKSAFPIRQLTSDQHWTVCLGNNPANSTHCVVAFEESSSLECMETWEVTLPDGWVLVDGERFPSGQWRDSQVVYATTKSSVVAAAEHAGLRPI